MKLIKVKSYNKLIEDITFDGDASNIKGKLQTRIVDALRLAKECRAAAEAARKTSNDEDAEWLDKRADDYEQAAKNWNQDILEIENPDTKDDSEDDNDSEEPEEQNESAAEKAESAARDAEQAAEQAKQTAEAAQQKADEQAQKGEDNTAAQDAADKAKASADEAAEAAKEAKQYAEEANKAEKAGDNKKAEAEADNAEKAAEKAKDAAKEANNAADSLNKDSNADGQSEDQANDNSSEQSDSDGSDNEANKSDSSDKADSQDSSANSDKSDNSNKSDAADKSDSSNSSDNQDDSDQNNSEDQDSSDKSSKGKSSGSGDSGDTGESDADDDNDEESDDAPVNDPFADDEDIPQLQMPGSQGAEPRDATIDDIIKQLKGLSGESKRGAVDGLKNLLKNKKESLSEAFNKGIREFSDEEWDELADETLERIEKVKKIDVIDTDPIKADFKSWSDNKVVQQELQDEENQNIQQDVLAKRASEKELDKYANLESLKDFELDFESCIRDQVEMVMQEYQSYDEINPEYEDEDIIMKADIQRMIPSEALPTIAVFFDQSGSWNAYAIMKGERAIATVKQKYVDTGLCKLDLWYFSDNVTNDRNSRMLHEGTRAWPYIISTIKQHDYKNVVIMTDSDMNGYSYNKGIGYTVEGCVWWIWKDGYRADELPKLLRGMQHNFECEFH